MPERAARRRSEGDEMNDTMVTVVGNVATDLVFRETQGGAMARFRLAVTGRRWHREEQRWVDGHTNFFTVATWRYLAHNVSSSVAIGDPVVVHGRLRLRDEVYEGERRLSAEIDAVSVGHDLARGTSAFRRPPRGDARSDAAATVVARERKYGPASWGPAADAAGTAGPATDLGGAARRGPARVGDVVDEMFLRQGAALGAEEMATSSGGTDSGESGQEGQAPAGTDLTPAAPSPGRAPALAQSAPAPALAPVAPVSSAVPVPAPVAARLQAPVTVPASGPSPAAASVPAAKRPVPWVTTPPAPDDEPGARASSRRKATEARLAPSAPEDAEPVATSTPARAPRRPATKRRVRATEGNSVSGKGVGAETGTGTDALVGVREAVSVGASLGDPDAVPPF
ncbi:single-stranded DNA-binding protein [Streptomyces sp. NPDC060243]|uniref:single-stranded DNA-binding protein n=1 Tax=Streptomyces sp. NPDC060243 TaxID=3347081 RepID=UPI0036671E20